MDRFADIRARLMAIAAQDATLQAVIAIGSATRQNTPADEFSDLDLIIATTRPEDWLYGDMPARLGEMHISFTEPTLGGGTERRMLYEGSLDVDLIVFTPDQLAQAILEGPAGWVMNRGYQVLHDTMGVAALIAQHIRPAVAFTPMGEAEFANVVNDFFFHAVWADKKLRRGEVWTAKMCIDAYLKHLLLRVIELDRCLYADVWHDGRFLDRWAGEDTKHALAECFAHYDPADMLQALLSTVRLFGRVARRAAAAHGYAYPAAAEAYAAQLLYGDKALDYSPPDGV